MPIEILGSEEEESGIIEQIPLEPFIHQVGGHSSILALGNESSAVCKPLVRREVDFYQKCLPAQMREFTAEFRGVVEVSSVEDENGAITLLAKAPARVVRNGNKCGNHPEESPESPGSQTSVTRNRLRILQSGIVEIEANCGEVQFEEKDPFNQDLVLSATNYNPWVEKCHRRHLNKVAGKEYAESKISHKFIVLENLTWRMTYPCVLDLKMGVRNFGDDAPAAKVRSQTAKCEATTSGTLGVRICGMQVYQVNEGGGGFLCWNKYHGRRLTVDGFRDSIRQFLDNGAALRLELVPAILSRLSRLRKAVETLETFRFYCSSLLIIYEGDVGRPGGVPDGEAAASSSSCAATETETDADVADVKVKLIDFANATCNGFGDPDQIHPGPDRGLLFGLDNLVAVFRSLLAKCGGGSSDSNHN